MIQLLGRGAANHSVTSRMDGWTHSVAEFRRLLVLERMRSDRTGSPLALLVFDLGSPARQQVRVLLGILEARLRATDMRGRWDDHRVGVLLPDTGEKGARVVRNAVLEAYGEQDGGLDCRASVYHQGQLHGDEAGLLAESSSSLQRTFVQPLPRWKRALDLLLAISSLVVLSPLLLLTAIVIKATSTGPVLFRQQRAGLGGKPFTVYKFRTMYVGADAEKAKLRMHSEQDGPAFKLKNDPRVTQLGRYLRRTCIDEFPQFINVVRGDMSIVGPRPLPLDEADDCEGWQRRRLDVTPGMTCIWQVSGGMQIPFVEWMRMDLRYIRSRSLWHDLQLLCRTGVAMVLHRASH